MYAKTPHLSDSVSDLRGNIQTINGRNNQTCSGNPPAPRPGQSTLFATSRNYFRSSPEMTETPRRLPEIAGVIRALAGIPATTSRCVTPLHAPSRPSQHAGAGRASAHHSWWNMAELWPLGSHLIDLWPRGIISTHHFCWWNVADLWPLGSHLLGVNCTQWPQLW